MAGIDNNTLLYLRGDSFSDLSLYNKTLSNNGCIIEDKSIKINAGNYINIDYDSNLLDVGTGDFTVSFNFKPINQINTHYIIAHQWANNNTGYAWGMRIYNNQLMLLVNSGSESVTYYNSDSIQLNSFAHYELCRKNGLVMIFINGKKIASFNHTGSLLSNTNRYISIGKIVRGTIGNLEGFLNNVFISKKCLHTEDFTPPTQPYNSITINKTNQTDTNIEFSIEKLGQETINKVEVLVNSVVSKVYTDNYDSINYLIDTDLIAIGNNDITIRVTYDDLYTEELPLTHTITIDKLPLETPLLDTVERVKLLTKSKQNEKNMLSNILTSKNVEVTEEDKMSDLIDKVDLLGEYDDGKLWLYKDGDECVDITGGFSKYGQVHTNITINKYPSYMEIKNTSTTATSNLGGFSSNNSIDTTGYNKLYIEVDLTAGSESGANAHILYVQTSKNQSSFSANTRVEIVGKNITSLDVSSFSKVYIGCWITYKNTVMKVTKLWLEK